MSGRSTEPSALPSQKGSLPPEDDAPCPLSDFVKEDEDLPDPTLDRDILRQHLNVRDICVLILTILAVFYSLYFTAPILLPFVFALVVNLMMIAPMRFLRQKLHLPKHLAALLLIVAMFGVVGGIATTISVPAAGWISRAPQTLPALQSKLAVLRGPIEMMQRDYQRLSGVFGGYRPSGSHAVAAPIGGETASSKLGTSVLAGPRAVAGGFFSMLLMLFFIMTEGDKSTG